jgi:hypothetical protein
LLLFAPPLLFRHTPLSPPHPLRHLIGRVTHLPPPYLLRHSSRSIYIDHVTMAAPRDALGHLPWKALEIIICNLPDLPSIFRVFEVSETARDTILSNVPNLAEIIEDNINRPLADGGLHPENKILLRLFALISWRMLGGSQEYNPLPRFYHNVIPALANTFSMAALSFTTIHSPWSTVRDTFATQPLHNSIPPMVIYQVLALSSLAQQISHGCFHDCMTRCMALPLRQLKPGEQPIVDFSLDARPQGIPLIPIDLGPPTYWEEQRLLQTTLRFFLFWDLKDAVNREIFIMDRPGDAFLLISDNIERYWCKPFEHGDSPPIGQRQRLMCSERHQMGAFLAWAKSCNPGVPLTKECLPSLLRNSPSSPPCCPLTPAHPDGFVSDDMAMVNGVAPAWSVLATLRGSVVGVDDDVDVFTPFGFDYWDHERLLAFGLTEGSLGRDHALDSYRLHARRDVFRLAFVWSSMLQDPRWRIDAGEFFEGWP